ncbi:MAG: type II secretion system F family protein [Verrucomicrobiia bacterium]|jgi:type II secretory pathway component PulF
MIAVVIYFLIWLLALVALAGAAYSLLILPLRRQERARMFLDLLETGLAEGYSAETAIVEIAKSRDKKLGYRFVLLAAYLETGLRLSDALQKVPELVPPQLAAMLAVGEHVGDIRKVMPACRRTLTSRSSRTTSAVNYLILFLALNPFCGLIWPFLTIVIVPKLQEIVHELTNGPLPPVLRFLLAHSILVSVVQFGLMAIIWSAVLVYLCGPRGIPWLAPVLKPLSDAVNSRLPWRRKRLERDFSAMLAVLLDAEVPEEQAVILAAQSTDNRVFIRQGALVAERLREGVPLTEAVQAFDETGEFRWRLTNAAHGRGGFMAALSGWHEALDAKAYQLEQAASQVITTGLVIFNGCIVGLIAVGVFQVLTSVVWELALW